MKRMCSLFSGRMRRDSLVIALFALLVTSTSVRAQSRVEPHPTRTSIDVSYGFHMVRGAGLYRDDRVSETTTGADILAAVRVAGFARGYLVTGVSAASSVSPKDSKSDCKLAPGGGCIPYYPTLGVIAGHLGWENRDATLRLLFGLARAYSEVDDPSLGGQVRVEYAAIATPRISGVGGVRATLVPDHNTDTFWILAAGFGLRIRL